MSFLKRIISSARIILLLTAFSNLVVFIVQLKRSRSEVVTRWNTKSHASSILVNTCEGHACRLFCKRAEDVTVWVVVNEYYGQMFDFGDKTGNRITEAGELIAWRIKFSIVWALFTNFSTLELTRKLCNPLDDWLESTCPTNHPAGYRICRLIRELKIWWIRL